MNFELTEPQRQIRDLCRDFAVQEIRPRRRRSTAPEFPGISTSAWRSSTSSG